jgi:hypothetical protein
VPTGGCAKRARRANGTLPCISRAYCFAGTGSHRGSSPGRDRLRTRTSLPHAPKVAARRWEPRQRSRERRRRARAAAQPVPEPRGALLQIHRARRHREGTPAHGQRRENGGGLNVFLYAADPVTVGGYHLASSSLGFAIPNAPLNLGPTRDSRRHL